jgi:hypothetical protein
MGAHPGQEPCLALSSGSGPCWRGLSSQWFSRVGAFSLFLAPCLVLDSRSSRQVTYAAASAPAPRRQRKKKECVGWTATGTEYKLQQQGEKSKSEPGSFRRGCGWLKRQKLVQGPPPCIVPRAQKGEEGVSEGKRPKEQLVYITFDTMRCVAESVLYIFFVWYGTRTCTYEYFTCERVSYVCVFVRKSCLPALRINARRIKRDAHRKQKTHNKPKSAHNRGSPIYSLCASHTFFYTL